jgi:hypothetical protein
VLADLSHSPISEALKHLSQERRSGDLEVRSGRVVKTLFFDHGRIVFAASNLKKDRLGESLVELGRITPDDFARAQSLMHEEGRRRRFGEALVRAGVMDELELGRSVARQVALIVRSLFRFTEGVASFEERRCMIPLDYMVSLSVYRLLYDGIRTMKSEDLVMRGLGDLDRRVTLTSVPPFHFELEQCSALELDVLEQAQRRITLRRLAWGNHGLEFARLRAVYAFCASGVLTSETDTDEDLRPPVIQMETGTFLLSALQRRPRAGTPDTVQQEVRGELQRSARFDRQEWLRLSAAASPDDVVRALEEKMERYHVLLETAGDDQKLRTDVETILGRAWSLMRTALHAAATKPSRPRAARGSEAVELLREGQLREGIDDYASAVEVYVRLVELEPDVADHHARLATAMARYPPTATDAERAFLEALRLAPDDATLHYRVAAYYRDMRMKGRAVGQLQAAVRLDPELQDARDLLEELSPGDRVLTSLRRQVRGAR